MEMRKVLAQELENLMAENLKIVLIDSDLSKPNGLFGLKKKFPERAMDIGIAEQNMACVAAGMSSYGFVSFISTFTPFATRRICDQIAISGAYAKQNIKIIGTDPGISAEFNGGTHMSMEDIGVLRSIPEVTIFEPVDEIQLRKMLPQVINTPGVVYIRMFRKEIAPVFNETQEFKLGKAALIQPGNDLSIFCSGLMVQETMMANKILKERNINVEIINIHTIKPIDKAAIVASSKKTKKVLTVENHNLLGGLRSAVAEILIEENPVPLRSIGVKDKFGQVGKMPFLKEVYEMTAQDIVKKAEELLSL